MNSILITPAPKQAVVYCCLCRKVSVTLAKDTKPSLIQTASRTVCDNCDAKVKKG